MKFAFLTVGLVGFIMIFLIIFTPNTLANVFLEDTNYKTKEIVLNYVTFIWIAFLFNGINLVISAYLTAIHKPLHSMIIAISRSFIFPVIFIFTLPFFFETQGIFLAIPMAEAITFLIAVILYRKFSPNKII